MKTGIYFLLSHGEIVYIGKTTRFPERLWQHKGQKMDYDSVRFIETERHLLADYEKRWILRFHPKYNSVFNRKRTLRTESPVPINDRKVKVYRYMKFRKLTEKSIIGFGPHREWTVGSMIERGKFIELIDIYFNLSHITFFDNILDLLKISTEWRIEKPGVNKEMGSKFKQETYASTMARRKQLCNMYSASRSLNKLVSLNAVSKDKQWLKNRNQGK